jgi:hypothetical protein
MRTIIRACRSKGVTLVELVVVMLSTLILGTFAFKAAMKTFHWANNSRISVEMSQLDKALEAFRTQFGEYPPDMHDQVLVWKFLKAKFPKCPREKYPIFANHSPASALYFWLGGPNGRGFSANAANPFDNGKNRIGPFFKFDPERVKLVDEVMQYFPPRSKGGSPYVYFRPGAKGYDGHPGWGLARPYRDSIAGKWIEPEKYQIICPGNDEQFGTGNHYPRGQDYDDANQDDMTSFSRGETLGSAIPKVTGDKDKSKKEE